MGTITGTVNHGITLGTVGAYVSPLTVTTSGYVDNPGSGAAIYGPAYRSWAVTNYGRIASKNANGIDLQDGGVVVNQPSNGAGGIIDASFGNGIAISGAVGTITNSGNIYAYSGAAVVLNAGGTAYNGPSGTLAGLAWGVYFGSKPGTLINAGTIRDYPRNLKGVRLTGGGAVFNQHGGLIAGYNFGVFLRNIPSYVSNSGQIVGTGQAGGIAFDAGGTLVNHSDGLITGPASGVLMQGGGTIVNAGTIAGSGTAGQAVRFVGSFTNQLIIEPGAVFGGAVVGGSGLDTLELDGTSGNPLTVSYNSLNISNFEFVAFGSGGYATLALTNMSGTPAATISNFNTTSDTINLTAIGPDGEITGQTATQLTVTGSDGSVSLTLDASDATSFTTVPDGAGTELLVSEAVCFCRGTLIMSEQGEVAVEELAVGDRVRTLSGALQPIVWIGMGRDLVTRANRLARPVIVRRGALADGIPRRDLFLTHGHSLYFDGVLIPVENLVNHHTILWDDTARVVEYYHIELAEHDIVLAEGAPAETFHDAGNRTLFQTERLNTAPMALAPTIAPVMHNGEIVERVWARLYARSGIGTTSATTSDPDLHLWSAGRRLDAAQIAKGSYTFTLDHVPDAPIRVRSRHTVPSLVGLDRHEHRRLGIALTRIVIEGDGVMTCLDHTAAMLREGGCYESEDGHCWTDGDLELPPTLFLSIRGPVTLVVQTRAHGLRYPLATKATGLAAVA